MKIARHDAKRRISWPMFGASTGTSMKVMKTRLITRAMASASNRSRTIAMTRTRVTAADAPIANRPAIRRG